MKMPNFYEVYQDQVEEQYDFGTGVSAYCSDKIEMKFNDFGEYFSSVSNSNVLSKDEIDKITYTSLVTNSNNIDRISKTIFSELPNVKFNEKIGYYSDLYIGYVKEGEFRKNGSSGGFATWILKELLTRNLIDGVVHVTATNDPKKLFKYTISRTEEELLAGAKTKYYPVEISEALKTIRDTPGKYAVIGLPSFIMELRLLCEVDPTINERIKYMVGLVCGHQKSTRFSELLAWQCGIKPGKLNFIDFRKKMSDSPASSYAIEVKGEKDGQEISVTRRMKDLYGGDWGRGIFKVRASDFTDDVMNEAADITLGDAWLPEYTKDSNGNNIIIVRNPEIAKIIRESIGDEKLVVDVVDSDKIIQSQISHYRHTQDELAYRLYKNKQKRIWFPEQRIQPSKSIPISRKMIQDIREKICLQAPGYFNKAIEKDNLDYFIKKMSHLDNSYRLVYKIERGINRISKA
ncbi:Coenzyme F420 hydrogenase/dehydrogenase, beta subunit C-terminal domain [Enterococcus asini]|uniref:Coenzyme F420 hydrogenase/dehydrogenase, beta subunit C-terminal domain n=1 Tax=Enterococcus asini TaxID=57732 RepID=UPI00289069CB|nr:Coenzyme F420 hydrogenase/dehydrogenase, beta subunit C-terminal domain [Enterococcus asini]MDT2757491.1 Coenzyme F420 hydrogenase/dehydrogenase, beta subunit C-terminal domain [Enterococcus asini]